MKKFFIVTCLLTFAFMISAQGGGMRQQTPEQIAAGYEQAKKDLNLNDKQFADYKKIDEEYQKKLQALRQSGGGDFEKMREENVKLTTERNTKMKAALTADQFKKYEEQLAQRRQGGPGGGGGNRQN